MPNNEIQRFFLKKSLDIFSVNGMKNDGSTSAGGLGLTIAQPVVELSRTVAWNVFYDGRVSFL